MKTLICALSAVAVVGFTPLTAQAADLDGYNEGYVERGPVVERPPVEDRYYDDYDDGPAVTYYAPRVYPYPYYGGYYPYGYGYAGRPYWRAHYWHGRPYWGGRGYRGGHRGWR